MRMRTITKAIVSLGMASAVLLLPIVASHAATLMEMYLSDTVNPPVFVDDNGPGDLDPTEGSVLYSGKIGSWIVNVTTSITYPALGTAGSPKLDFNSVDVSSGGGSAVLSLGMSALAYTFAPGGTTFQIGGNTDGTLAAEAYSGGASYFDSGTSLGGPLAFLSQGAFSGTVGGLIPASPNPYSLTIFALINHEGDGSTSFDAKLAAVPLPPAILLLGPGLLGLFGIRKRIHI